MNHLVSPEVSSELKVEIATRDGRRLVGSLFRSSGNLHRAVVVAPAMGVGQTFYHPFARFLVDRGFTVLTFDYRGMGASARSPARSSAAHLYDWGRADIAGALACIEERCPGDRLLYVGHSIGTQLLGLTPDIHKIEGLVAVTAPNGYWRLWSGADRLKLFLYWYLVFPLATRLLGYFPARRLRLGLDLPGGVARDWTRWARTPGYVVDEQGRPVLEHFAAFRAPVLAFGFTDDPRATERSIKELLDYFSEAPVDHRHIRPEECELVSIGHMGFFRDNEPTRTTLWQETADWLTTV